jgi:[ribosomal protein S5]-alanine N-acetyltransferase
MIFGDICLETPRLKLRRLRDTDLEDLFAVYSDPITMKYWSCLPFTEQAQAQEMINKANQYWDAGESLRWAVEFKPIQKCIGTISIFEFHPESKRTEIGYILLRAYWGQGLMTEALKTAVDYIFTNLKLNRIEADIDPRNSASTHLLQKIGFLREGLLKERWIINGVVCDSEIYGLTKTLYDRLV